MPTQKVQCLCPALSPLTPIEKQQFGLSAFVVSWKRDLVAGIAYAGQTTLQRKGRRPDGAVPWVISGTGAITWRNLI